MAYIRIKATLSGFRKFLPDILAIFSVAILTEMDAYILDDIGEKTEKSGNSSSALTLHRVANCSFGIFGKSLRNM